MKTFIILLTAFALHLAAETNSPAKIEEAFGVTLGKPLPTGRAVSARTNVTAIFTRFIASNAVPNIPADSYEVSTSVTDSRVHRITLDTKFGTDKEAVEMAQKFADRLTEKYGPPSTSESSSLNGRMIWKQNGRSIRLLWTSFDKFHDITLDYDDDALRATALKEFHAAEKNAGF